MPSEVSAVTSASAWRSCSICLEETFDEDIRIHTICGGSLCVSCLGKTAEYHYFEKFPCPVSKILICNLSVLVSSRD